MVRLIARDGSCDFTDTVTSYCLDALTCDPLTPIATIAPEPSPNIAVCKSCSTRFTTVPVPFSRSTSSKESPSSNRKFVAHTDTRLYDLVVLIVSPLYLTLGWASFTGRFARAISFTWPLCRLYTM